MNNSVLICASIALLFLVSGCASVDQGQMATILPDDYILGPGDVIEVSVLKRNDLSKVVKIRPDGQVSLPLIGDIKASGSTPASLKGAIESKLREYKENQIVSVNVKELGRAVDHGQASAANGKPAQSWAVPNSPNRMDYSYTIGPEDVIEVSVWKNADLSKVVKVRPDGQISLPLIGDVKASGLTPEALKDAIANKLTEYKETPMVSVIVQEINSYNVFVMGEVVHPGKYSLKSNTTFLQALSLAGGFTPYASRNKILLMRQDPRTLAVTEIRVKYDTVISGKNPQRDILLIPGDTIVVP